MGKLILYGNYMSPPVRACLLVGAEIGIEFEFREIQVIKGEHLRPEFIKKNPQHTIPTLEDDDKIIWDSHAILPYLVGKFAKNDSLYPKDLYQRALIDQRLHLEGGNIFQKLREGLVYIHVEKKGSSFPPSVVDPINETYDLLEKLLDNNNYMVGNNMTIADFSLISSISTIKSFIPISEEKHPKLLKWIKRMESLPYYSEVNDKGSQILIDITKKAMEELKIQNN